MAAPVGPLVSPRVSVAVRGLTKRFPTGTVALDDIGLTIADGEFVSVIGPSGCGKTTLLRIIAGLETQTSGTVEIRAGEPRVDALVTAFKRIRGSHGMTVRENVKFAFDALPIDAAERRRRASEQLALVGLTGFRDAYPVPALGREETTRCGRASVRG